MENLWPFIVAGVGFILTVLNIIDKVTTMKKNAGAPQRILEERLKLLEVKIEEHERSLQLGNDNFREQRETNEVIQQCMLALIDFELSFCLHTEYPHTEDLQEAKKVLRKHLSKN